MDFFLSGRGNECAMSTCKDMNEFHKYNDEWKSNTKQYKLYDFMYKKQVAPTFGLRNRVNVRGCDREGLSRTFWDAGKAPFLDPETGYAAGVFATENSLSQTFSFLYGCYTSIQTFKKFKSKL